MKVFEKISDTLPYLLIFLVFFLPAIDTDLGWHLRYGEYFFQHGRVLKENTFTYFLPDHKWGYSTGLFDLASYLIYKPSGLLGLAFSYGLLSTLMFWFFNRLNKGSSALSFLGFAVLLVFSWNVFYLGWRAQVFTILFILIELWILKKSEIKTKWLYLLPALFVLWANTHGGFVIGILILSLQLFSVLGGGEPGPPRRWSRFATLTLALFISCLGTLLNPYGNGIWEETLIHSQYPLHTLIAEWVKPGFTLGVLSIVISAVLIVFLWKQKNKEKVFYSLLLLLGLTLFLEAKRNTPFLGLFAIVVSLEIFKDKLKKISTIKTTQLFSHLAITSGIILLALIRIPHTLEMSTNWESYCTKGLVKLPCSSVSWFRTFPRQGANIYSAYEWGGFLEWQLPQYKYFVDGRMPVWATPSGKSPYTEYLEIIQAKPGWNKRLEDYKTDILLIGAGTFLDIELAKNPSNVWKEKYRDSTSVIYTKQ